MRRRAADFATAAAQAGPAAAVILLLMAAPLCLMVYVSFVERNFHGGVNWDTFSAEAYVRILFERQLDDSLAFSTDYLSIFWRSFWLAGMTTVFAFLVGFPTALFIATRPPAKRAFYVFLVTVPFWTNLLIRNYAWILLLRDHGAINGLLMWLGITDAPIVMLHTGFAVAVGLTYSFLPFMVLPIYSSLEKMDWRLVEAAFDLYGGRWTTMRRVILPLAGPGMIAGAILVFVPCLGAYVTPELLGGGKTLLIGNLIGLQFGSARNWPFGAALGFILLAIVLVAMTVYALRARRAPAASGIAP